MAKQTGLSERQVERWWRRRRAQDKPTTLVKFSENSFRFLYYTCSSTFGLFVLWDKAWLWDINHCYIGFPHRPEVELQWYYAITAGFYLSLMISQFSDVRRKDFWEMFAHHVITIFLLAFSWYHKFHRIGSLVIIIHDCADIFLEVRRSTLNCYDSYFRNYSYRQLKLLNMHVLAVRVISFLPCSS